MEFEKQFIATVLQALNLENISVSKILLHKFIFFLDTQGIRVGFRFEPYIYGPYSFDLAHTLYSMDFWGEISEKHTYISIIDLHKYDIDDSLLSTIREYFSLFKSIVGNFNFSSLELVGTLLYCIQVLKNYRDDFTECALIEEFKEWKHNKFTDEEIHHAYDRLKFIYRDS